MDNHKNAKLTPQSRAVIVRRVLVQGQPPAAVARSRKARLHEMLQDLCETA